MAIQRQRPGAGLIHHSDRGSQYAFDDYRQALANAEMVQSTSIITRGSRIFVTAALIRKFGDLARGLLAKASYKSIACLPPTPRPLGVP